MIDQHLKNLQNIYPREVEEIRRSLYVDDLINSDKTVAGTRHLKQVSQSIFRAGKFELHKWHSNVPSLEQSTPHEETMEERPTTLQNENQSYAKDQLGDEQGERSCLVYHGTNERKQYKPVSLTRLRKQLREKSLERSPRSMIRSV